METLFDLLPVLLFLLFAVANFARSPKRDAGGPAPRSSEGGPEAEDDDFASARRMVEDLKRRAEADGGDFPRGPGDGSSVFEPGETFGDQGEIFAEVFEGPAETSRPELSAPRGPLPEPGDFAGAGPELRADCRRDAGEAGEPDADAYNMKVRFPADSEDSAGGGSFEVRGDFGGGAPGARAAFSVPLGGRGDLRRAFVLSEIISKPLALRPREERLPSW